MSSDDSDRQRRLAEALRANLRRRKGQARERTKSEDAGDRAVDTVPQATPGTAQD